MSSERVSVAENVGVIPRRSVCCGPSVLPLSLPEFSERLLLFVMVLGEWFEGVMVCESVEVPMASSDATDCAVVLGVAPLVEGVIRRLRVFVSASPPEEPVDVASTRKKESERSTVFVPEKVFAGAE